ncbi:MAG: redoxin domain-containing protein [Prolixibacteraceae bacterium]|nr:redoxin domain-containing protein [Prolixibacteraceae bacterium]
MNTQRFISFLLILSFPVMLTARQPGIPAGNNEKAAKNITKADFIEKVMDYEKNPTQWVYKGDKPCLIDFYADWCGPCRITSPILEELAQEFKGKINVYKVNVDKEKELSQVFGISGIPAFLYCPMEGKPSMTSGIARDKDQTKKMFRDNIEKLLLKN